MQAQSKCNRSLQIIINEQHKYVQEGKTLNSRLIGAYTFEGIDNGILRQRILLYSLFREKNLIPNGMSLLVLIYMWYKGNLDIHIVSQKLKEIWGSHSCEN